MANLRREVRSCFGPGVDILDITDRYNLCRGGAPGLHPVGLVAGNINLLEARRILRDCSLKVMTRNSFVISSSRALVDAVVRRVGSLRRTRGLATVLTVRGCPTLWI